MQKGTIHMTLRECYEMMCGDYEGVTGRLVSESLVRKFALKFLNDPSFGQLQAAIESGDGAEAFRASHTLKGICLNLGFTALFDASSAETILWTMRANHFSHASMRNMTARSRRLKSSIRSRQ